MSELGAVAPLWAWPAFVGALLALIGVDLVLHRGTRMRSRRALIVWTVGWIAVGLSFSLLVWALLGGARAREYVAAYLVEKSLSVDNLFVFLVVFKQLRIPAANQRAVLAWGILGALAFRLVFIVVGVAVIERFHGVVYVFAALLAFAAVRALRDDPATKEESRVVSALAKRLPVSPTLAGNAFFVRVDGRRLATPLFVALCAIELTDIVFAIDSVPAAIAISQSSFVVFTSNALALLGLRSLYSVVEHAIGALRYLRFGLAAVLLFAAVKLVASNWIEIPPGASVLVVVLCIGASVAASLVRASRSAAPRQPAPAAAGA